MADKLLIVRSAAAHRRARSPPFSLLLFIKLFDMSSPIKWIAVVIRFSRVNDIPVIIWSCCVDFNLLNASFRRDTKLFIRATLVL